MHQTERVRILHLRRLDRLQLVLEGHEAIIWHLCLVDGVLDGLDAILKIIDLVSEGLLHLHLKHLLTDDKWFK